MAGDLDSFIISFVSWQTGEETEANCVLPETETTFWEAAGPK